MKKLLLLAVALVLPTLKVYAQTYTVTPSATSYLAAGGQLTFTVNLSYPAGVAAVSISAKPPGAGWAMVSTGGTNQPPIAPNAGDTTDPGDPNSKWGWAYGASEGGVPASPASFTFTVQYPASLAGNQTIAFSGDYRLNGEVSNITVTSAVLNPTPVAPAISAQPANATATAGQNATFTVGVTGVPAPEIQWQLSTNGGGTWANVENGTGFAGVTTTTLTVNAVTLAMQGHRFRAVATNSLGPVNSDGNATLTVNQAPTITQHPSSQSIATGGNVTFVVAASGNPAPTYKWQKGTTDLSNGGRISGANTASLTISNLQAGDEGSYRAIATNGISPDANSNAATLTLLPAGFGATHALVGAGYVASGTITITNTISYSGDISSLGYSVTLPTGWTYASGAGSTQSAPVAGTVGTLTWAWTDIGSLTPPITFTYTLNVPANAAGTYQFPATAIVADVNANQFNLLANPNPLVVGPVLYHTADTSGDFKINLSELLRVISYYNTRFTNPDNTKTQTGAYKLQSGTPDGYAPDLAKSAVSAANQGGLASYHAADTDKNGSINLSELLRVISYYNTRFTNPDNTKSQTGAYKIQQGTPDGYAPDLTRAP